MAGTFPIDATGIAALRFLDNDPTVSSTAGNGRQHKRKPGGGMQRFEMTVGLPQSTSRAQLDVVLAFLAKQRGSFDSFEIVLPKYSTPRGVATGSPAINNVGGYAAGAEAIEVDGFTASTTGILLANDKIRFAGHTKVYRVVDDADADGSGNALLNISPPLIESVTDGEALTVTGVPFTVCQDGDVQGFRAIANRGPDRHVIEIDLVESF